MEPTEVTPKRQPIFRFFIAVFILIIFAIDLIWALVGGDTDAWTPIFYFAAGLLGGTLFTQAWYERRARRTAAGT